MLVHNSLLWPAVQMKELRGFIRGRLIIAVTFNTVLRWSARSGPDSWCRGREAAGSLSVLQLRIKRVVLPNRQWRLYPLRNRTVNFVNSSRSNQTPPQHTHTHTFPVQPTGRRPAAAAGGLDVDGRLVTPPAAVVGVVVGELCSPVCVQMFWPEFYFEMDQFVL